MKLDHLRYFDHLASELNYTKAAQDLYIAQPTLSTSIKRMEQELGFPLFRRSGGVASSVELTEEGKIFREYASQALERFDTGLRLAQESLAISDRTLRLGTVYSMKGTFWSQAIDSFLSTCDTLPRIHMEQAYSTELSHQLKDGEIDVAFTALTPASKGLYAVPVWSQPLVVCVNRKHPLSKCGSVTLDMLAEHRLLTYSEKSSVSVSLDKLLDGRGCELNLIRSFGDEIALSSFVASNPERISLLVYSFLVNAFDDVVCLPIRDVPLDFHKIYLMSRKEEHSQLVGDFIDFMSTYPFPIITAKSQVA